MAFDYIIRIGLVLLFVTILVSVFNVGTALVCWLASVRIKKLAVFFGRPVFTFETRLGPISVGYIPLGGYVELDMELFPTKPLVTRCFVRLAGPLFLFFSSLICLGFTHSMASFTSTYPQLVKSVASPLSYGKALVAGYLANAQTAPIVGYGILAAKNAALNLLPLPTLPGGQLLIEFIEMMLKRFFPRHTKKIEKFLNYLQSLIVVIIIVCLVAGVIAFFWKH